MKYMNITLIGMPGAGKSTVGRIVAERMGLLFIDIDKELEKKFGMTLQQLLDELGEEAFLQAEQTAILTLDPGENSLISPGGSVVYSTRAMECLKSRGKVVYLDVPTELLEGRIHTDSRGVVHGQNMSLRELYDERNPLYRKWADVVVELIDAAPEENAALVLNALGAL